MPLFGLILLGCGLVTAAIAWRGGAIPLVWSTVGLFFGPIGVLFAMHEIPWNAPKLNQHSDGWASEANIADVPLWGPEAYGATPTSQPAWPAPVQGANVEQRLATLERLREASTVTDEEYAARRSQILDDL